LTSRGAQKSNSSACGLSNGKFLEILTQGKNIFLLFLFFFDTQEQELFHLIRFPIWRRLEKIPGYPKGCKKEVENITPPFLPPSEGEG